MGRLRAIAIRNLKEPDIYSGGDGLIFRLRITVMGWTALCWGFDSRAAILNGVIVKDPPQEAPDMAPVTRVSFHLAKTVSQVRAIQCVRFTAV